MIDSDINTWTDADWVEAVSLCLLRVDGRLTGPQVHLLAVHLCARPECRALSPQAAIAIAALDGPPWSDTVPAWNVIAARHTGDAR